MRVYPLFCALLLLLSVTAHAAAPSSNAASKQNLCLQDEKCREHYASANELYKAGKLLAAVVEFEAAYSEIQLPVFLYNLGRLHHRIGNLEKAAGYYRQFLAATVDEDPEQRVRAKEYLSQVQISMKEASALTPPATMSPPTSASQPSEKKPIYKKWWLWTLTGAAVAGATIGLVVGLTAHSGPAVPDGLPLIMLTF